MSNQPKPSPTIKQGAVPNKFDRLANRAVTEKARDAARVNSKYAPKVGQPARRENTPQARVQSNLQSVSELAYVKAQVTSLKAQLAKQGEELEIERLRLAGCTEAAMSNTPESVAKRLPPGHQFYSASYGDVCSAVDEQIRLREVVKSLEAEIARLRSQPLDETKSLSISPAIRAIIG